jgi:hypothetical protein
MKSFAAVLLKNFMVLIRLLGPPRGAYFEAWHHHYNSKVRERWAERLYLAGGVVSIHGAIRFAAGGVGCIAFQFVVGRGRQIESACSSLS